MNQDIKTQWTTALRSSKYKKGRDYLNNNNRFCCLGVLCELATEAQVCKKAKYTNINYTELEDYNILTYDNQHDGLPESVQKWAGINYRGWFVDEESHHKSLSILNDTGSTFEDLADIIEEYF